MMKWIRRILLVAILAVGVGFTLYTKKFRPVPVMGHEVTTDSLVIEVMGTGSVQARISTIVSSKIQGRLVSLDVDDGHRVVAGSVIATLDDSDLARQVELSQATLEATQAGLDRLRADEARARAVLRLAIREDERRQQAFTQGAVTEAEIDESSGAVAIAQADVARALAAIAEGKKLIIAATKGFEYQEARLSDTIIVAPFDGLIIRRDRDPGDIVVPGSSIYRIVATDEIWVSAWVDETAMAALDPTQPARIILRSEPQNPYPGHVVRLGRETDPETREFIVDVAMEKLPEHWAIGQRAEVFIQTRQLDDVLVVPLTYLHTIAGTQGVFVVKTGKAVWTPCVIGARGREFVEVRDGLTQADVIVRPANSRTQGRLTNGKRVDIK